MDSRRTTRSMLTVMVLAIVFAGISVAQDAKFERAKKIYDNLEYNTAAFDDLKHTWNITDPGMVRHIFNKFVIKNALMIDGSTINSSVLEHRIQYVYDGEVSIELRKRYYDDEIELLRFFTEIEITSDSSKKQYFFDPVEGYLEIKDILGEATYESIKSKSYPFTDLTKSTYTTYQNYNFDLYLHLIKPRLMLYTLTTNARNRLLFSVFGNWGNEHTNYPGWYFPEYFAGVSVTYLDSLLPKGNYEGYKLDIGMGVQARQAGYEFNDDPYGARLFKSGENIYFKLTGNPLKMVLPELERLYLKLEGMFRVSEFGVEKYKIDYISRFYSVNNFFVFFANYKDYYRLADTWNLQNGIGFSINDVVHYQLEPAASVLRELDSGKQGTKFTLFTEAALEKNKGMLKHKVAVQINYNFSDDYGYFGFKSRLMLSKVLGFDLGYYKAFTNSVTPLPFYRLDNYIVFSPIIRINY